MFKKQLIKRLLLLGLILPLASLASAADDPFDWTPADCERKYLGGPNGVFLGIYCDFFVSGGGGGSEAASAGAPDMVADYATWMLTDVNDIIPLVEAGELPEQVIAELYEAAALHPESFRVLIFKAIVTDPWKEEGIHHDEEWFIVKISEEQQYVMTGLREDRSIEIFVKPQGLFELPEITFMKTENALLDPSANGNSCSIIGSWGILPQFCSIAPPQIIVPQTANALSFKVLTFGKAGLPVVADELDLSAEEIAEFEALIEDARDRTLRVLVFRTQEEPESTEDADTMHSELKIAILTDRQSIVLQTLGFERKFSLVLKKERRHIFRTLFPRVPVLITKEIPPSF